MNVELIKSLVEHEKNHLKTMTKDQKKYSWEALDCRSRIAILRGKLKKLSVPALAKELTSC